MAVILASTANRRRILLAIVSGLLVFRALSAAADPASPSKDLNGAGATFPYPIYAKWGAEHQKESGVGLNYQGIGSGGGIKQIIARTVTFGATDKPLSAAELIKEDLAQFPTVLGGITGVFNLEGVATGDLVLDGPTIARIYLGEIKQWDDPAIARLNPSLNPHQSPPPCQNYNTLRESFTRRRVFRPPMPALQIGQLPDLGSRKSNLHRP